MKAKYDKASKEGIDISDLKKQLDDLDKQRLALVEREEQMKKKEKVSNMLI